MLVVDVVHRESGDNVALPSTPYQSLPSQAPSRSGWGHHHGALPYSTVFSSSTSSSTAALIQADVFCSGRIRPGTLLRLRVFFCLLLLAGAITAPLCEHAGGRCAAGMGASRDDPSLGERGTLAGEGQPEPDADADPSHVASAHMRTAWMVASLSYVTSLALLLYFALLLAITYAYRLLFKQCCSYDYDSLSVVSSSSTAAHPLVTAMKLAALLFQLIVPTTIGMCVLYFVTILPWRLPLSWPISMHFHLLTGIMAMTELLLSRFLFRLKALVYWCFLCVSYCALLMALYIAHGRWEYVSMSRTRSLSGALFVWLGAPLFLGPFCFFLAAGVQYLRDGCARALWTSPVDISASAAAAHAASMSVLHKQGGYIHGALERYVSDGDSEYSFGAVGARTPSAGGHGGHGVHVGDAARMFSPNRPSAAGQRSLNPRQSPPVLDWPVVYSSGGGGGNGVNGVARPEVRTPAAPAGWIADTYRWVSGWWTTPQ